MRKIVSILLLSLSIITLIACSKNNYQSLDGEYYWISSERNELAFTIKGENASIEHGEADSFTINKKKNTIELTGQNIASRTEEYSFKDGVFSVDISGVKHDYYLKDSEAYKNALKQYGYKLHYSHLFYRIGVFFVLNRLLQKTFKLILNRIAYISCKLA